MPTIKFWRKPTDADKAKAECLARNAFEEDKTFSATWDAAQGLWTVTGHPHILVMVSTVQCTVKLSEAQCRVLSWLGKKWPAHQAAGAIILVNNKRVCNIDTIMALMRAGLVEEDGPRCWRATEAGRQLVQDNNL